MEEYRTALEEDLTPDNPQRKVVIASLTSIAKESKHHYRCGGFRGRTLGFPFVLVIAIFHVHATKEQISEMLTFGFRIVWRP